MPVTNEEAATRNPAIRRGSLAGLIESQEARQLGERVGCVPAGECFGELSSAGKFRDASVVSLGSPEGKAVVLQIPEAGWSGGWCTTRGERGSDMLGIALCSTEVLPYEAVS